MKPHKIWVEQYEAARDIESEFGTQKALAYLIGETFITFLEVADVQPYCAGILARSHLRTYSHDQIGRPMVPQTGCRTMTASVTQMWP